MLMFRLRSAAVATALFGALLAGMVQTATTQPAHAQQAPAQQPGQGRVNKLLGPKSWAYQLNNLGEEQRKRIADSSYDMVVVDYAWDPDGGAGPQVPLTREQVAAMQRKPDGSKRLIIAYLSVGETENDRYYWKPEWNSKRPAWMGKESKGWKGNYLVQYWQPVWQNIIFGNPDSYVDKIIAGGFDGFYIDRGDAYYYYGDTKQARDRMEDFMVRLIAYIRTKQPDSGILVQNAEEMVERPKWVDAIDGIAKEDLMYGIKHREEINKQDEIRWSNNLLKSAQDKGKAIFVVEYLTQPANIEKAKAFMADNKYVLYYGPRGLFEIVDPNKPVTAAASNPRAKPEPGVVGKTINKIENKLRR